jgi:hypothetical protein
MDLQAPGSLGGTHLFGSEMNWLEESFLMFREGLARFAFWLFTEAVSPGSIVPALLLVVMVVSLVLLYLRRKAAKPRPTESAVRVEVWMCPECRMVAATVEKPNEGTAQWLARTQAQHGEHSPDCDADALRFRGVVASAITGDRVLWGPVEQKERGRQP